MKHGPGMIGLACGELARYSDFIPSVVALQKPQGTMFMKGSGLGPAYPFNGIAQQFLDQKELEWLFLMNDDNLVPPSAIIQLLNRNVDVVSGLYFGRLQPFEPILFDKVSWVPTEVKEVLGPDGRTLGGNMPTIGPPYYKRWYTRHLMQNDERGLMPAVAVGDGCLLIRRHVLEAMSPPWWEYGETMTDQCDHDVVFSRKVREAGFGLYCDLDVIVDHVATFAVRPHRTETGEWEVHLKQSDRYIVMPAASK